MIESYNPSLSLPIAISKEEILDYFNHKGTVFYNHTDFIKQTIVDAFFSSNYMEEEAVIIMKTAINARVDKNA